jgi:hypothetical protein
MDLELELLHVSRRDEPQAVLAICCDQNTPASLAMPCTASIAVPSSQVDPGGADALVGLPSIGAS